MWRLEGSFGYAGETMETKVPRIGKNGLIIFDGSCGTCSALVGENEAFFERYGFTVSPLQADGITQITGLDTTTLMRSIHLYTPEGAIFAEADFLLHLGSRIWWARPFAWIFSIPPMTPLLRVVYRFVARRRKKISTICGLQSKAIYKS